MESKFRIRDRYAMLHKAQLTIEYLHSNSTTHEFLFGAMAELIDNSLDAQSTDLHIYTELHCSVRGGFSLCFLDNGCGMNPSETMGVVSFGKSTKRSTNLQAIGQYGNGLKSGTMRIGNDMLLFTKKDGLLSCLMLSRTFHESEGIEQVVVPLPVFDASTLQPVLNDGKSLLIHNFEMNIIYQYSPYDTTNFMAQFDKIQGSSGTLIVVYNLKLVSTGTTELDISSQKNDILIANPGNTLEDLALCPERRSLRHYVSILYYNPSMRLTIQGKKVRSTRIIYTLYEPREYIYNSDRFRKRAEKELYFAKNELKLAEERALDTEKKIDELNQNEANKEDLSFETGKLKLLLDDQQKVVLKRKKKF
ncbi:hypothetical protein ACOME3_010557 [Neoechinorhynchus agilis]